MLDPHTIGTFVDSVAGQTRTPATVAGRFIEEAVELCLAAGLMPNQIMGHVMDSIHNQCGKAGRRADKVIYPSQYQQPTDHAELSEEMADCSIILKDLAYVAGVDIGQQEDRKWRVFITRKFNVSPSGTLYAIK